MSSDQTLFRARLTGTIIDDPADTAPAGEKGALVTYAREDTWPSVGDGVELGVAAVRLPNGVRCPTYAAKLAFWGTVGTPPTLTPDQQPRVMVRRDLMSVGPTSVCQAVVITLPILASVKEHWGDTVKEVLQGQYAELTFADPLGNIVEPRLGYLPTVVGTPDRVSAGSLVACFLRMDVTLLPDPAPATYTHAWILQGIGIEDHQHLRAGPGQHGGGPAFAAYAPFTVGEANALGYSL